MAPVKVGLGAVFFEPNNLFIFDCPDLRSLVETIKFARRLAQQEPLKNIFEGKSKSFFVIFAFD